jgi:hypothetical protein
MSLSDPRVSQAKTIILENEAVIESDFLGDADRR